LLCRAQACPSHSIPFFGDKVPLLLIRRRGGNAAMTYLSNPCRVVSMLNFIQRFASIGGTSEARNH
jgi:hypothetical protein